MKARRLLPNLGSSTYIIPAPSPVRASNSSAGLGLRYLCARDVMAMSSRVWRPRLRVVWYQGSSVWRRYLSSCVRAMARRYSPRSGANMDISLTPRPMPPMS